VRELTVASVLPAPTQRNVADFVFENARTRPEHVALRRYDGSQWRDITAGTFADEVAGLAKGLMAAGIAAGDRVAVMSKTRYEWTVADFALFSAGAIVVPIYETSSAEQVQWILADAGCRAIFVETTEHAALVADVRAKTPSVADVWVFDDDAVTELARGGATINEDDLAARRAGSTLDDLASIIYTSGTTGRPKGCELTHANLVSEVSELLVSLQSFFNEQTSTLLFLPIAHVFGRAIELGCIASGCTLGHAPDVKNLLDDLAGFKPTFVLSVPRVFEKVYNGAKQKARAGGKGKIFELAEDTSIAYSRALSRGSVSLPLKLKHAVFDKLVYSKLRAALGGQCFAAVSGGAPLGERLGHFFRGAGVTIYEGYGLTETTAGICVNTPEDIRVGTVGRPVPGNSVRIADDGELLVRGGVVFRGYWNNETATKEAIDDEGWFHTGDIGEIDDAGFVTITGRKKELIVTAAGKNVAPAVLEDRVRANWLVGQVLVVGDRQPFIAALITIDPEALPQWLADNGRPADTALRDVVDDPALLSVVQHAVDEANKAVSHAEAIKKFVILTDDWTEEGGQITPSLKLKRSVVQADYADEISALFSGARSD
jgi:long-chain acyl-CoA synthetase